MDRIETEKLLAITDPTERYKASIDYFAKKRDDVSVEVREKFEEKGLNICETAILVECDPGGLSNRLKRNFTLPFRSLIPFCYDVMKQSCHELFFGEKAPTLLPGELSVMVEALFAMPGQKQKEIFEDAQRRLESAKANGSAICRNPVAAVLRSRIEEMSCMKGTQEYQICGEDAPANLKMMLSRYKKNAEEGKARTGNIETIMYLAMSCGTSIDYFLCLDYPTFTDLKLYKKGIIITDREIRKFVSCFLQLPKEQKLDVFGQIMASKLNRY